MKKQLTKVLCDECKGDLRPEAIVICETHSLDLCETHMRKHFDRAACRLVPVEREPTPMDRLIDRLSS